MRGSFSTTARRAAAFIFLYMNGSRAGTVPRAELRDFRGAIQTDGYGVYDYFELLDNVTLLGCMAHVRRKFTNVQASHPELAARAVKWLELLYDLEENLKAKGATYEEIAVERQAKALPIMDAMEKWMESEHTKCTPSAPHGQGTRLRLQVMATLASLCP